MTDAEVASRGAAVATSLTGNSNFQNPPVDPSALKAAVESLTALMAEALDGSKKVIAEKNKQRDVVIKMLRLLARYVEVNSNDDIAILQSSGFEAVVTTRSAQDQRSQAIRTVRHGAISGQIVIRLKALLGALSYELRYAPVVNGVPGAWTTQLVPRVKLPIVIDGLTPGTTYAFEVRAMTRAGYTDWSDTLTCMSV
jgi:hypothetical protein